MVEVGNIRNVAEVALSSEVADALVLASESVLLAQVRVQHNLRLVKLRHLAILRLLLGEGFLNLIELLHPSLGNVLNAIRIVALALLLLVLSRGEDLTTPHLDRRAARLVLLELSLLSNAGILLKKVL